MNDRNNAVQMLIEKYVHESCDQESINCFLCEFGGESVEMGYLVMVFFVELFGSLVLCWLVYLIENMGKRVSVVALSFIFRIILLSFEHTLGAFIIYKLLGALSKFIHHSFDGFY